MSSQKKFSMGTTKEKENASSSDDIDRFVAGAPSEEEEPVDRMNLIIPRRLRLRFNQEAAMRDIKKQDLIKEIFEFYFVNK